MRIELKLFYAAGAVDAVNVFRQWRSGRTVQEALPLSYCEQFFNVARRLGSQARVVASSDKSDQEMDGRLEVYNRPKSVWRGGEGDWFNGTQLILEILRWRPDVAVIADGVCPWWLLWIPKLAGIKIVSSVHRLLWSPADGSLTMLWWFRAFCMRWCSDAILCSSAIMGRQIGLLGRLATKMRYFLPTYRLAVLSDPVPSPHEEGGLRLLYSGALESDKGVFDLLKAFEVLDTLREGYFTLDILGCGPAAAMIEREIIAHGWEERVFLRGCCDPHALRRHLSSCHIVVAPAVIHAVDDFDFVISESVIACKPVVATSVCPLAHRFPGAVAITQPKAPDELAASICRIAESEGIYNMMQSAASEERWMLYSSRHSWQQSLDDVIGVLTYDATVRSKGAIGYLVPQFPSQTHAFFWREVCALREMGQSVILLSTREPEASACSHAFAASARSETVYLNQVTLGDISLLAARGWRSWLALHYVFSLRESTWKEKCRLLLLIPCAARLLRVAREKGLEHVHIHSCADAAHLGALAMMLGDLPYSVTVHGDLPVYGKDHDDKFAQASWVAAVTRPLHNQVVTRTRMAACKVPVIWMGVDTGCFHSKLVTGSGAGPLKFVTVARLIAQKGHHDALQAIALLRERGVEISYTIAGVGPHEAEIRNEIQRLNLWDSVTLAGNLSEEAVRSLLESSDAFVLPSYGLGEAAPVSVMEAMACGLAVIATRIGGTPDMISHLEDGLLVPQRDVALLAEAMQVIANDVELRARLGRAARAKAVEMFDHKVNAAKLLEWIRGRQAENGQGSLRASQRILLVMEQCNPLWPSVPRVAFEIYHHLAKIADVTLVTHARNRPGLRERFPDAEIEFIEESPFVRRYYQIISRVFGGRGANWPLLHALGYPVYAEFDSRVYKELGQRVRDGEFRAVLAATPILPRYPYAIAKACKSVPFILGPVNGGLPFPNGFGGIAIQENASFNFLRNFCRLLPGYNETYRRADRVLVGSEYTLQWVRKTFPEITDRTIWMPENGLSRQFFINRKGRCDHDAHLQLLFAGRLVPYKGADILVEAMAMAQARVKRELRLRVVGDGPMRQALEKLATKRKIKNAISFSGQVKPEDMPSEFENADLFCFPSIREFGGAVVLEAMASGTPCIVVDHGGIGEYVTENCGVKIKPVSRGYLVIRFSDAIVRAATDQEWLLGMGRAARARAEEFSWEAKVRRIDAIITQAVDERTDLMRLVA